MKTQFDSIEAVLADLRKGKMVIVVDDEDRENEGDLIVAGEHATPAAINFMIRHARGLVCVPTTSERLQQLGIERMVSQNRESHKTDFQVSVDAARGITTGISAADRAQAVRVMADPQSKPGDLVQPGHMFPLRAKPGGVHPPHRRQDQYGFRTFGQMRVLRRPPQAAIDIGPIADYLGWIDARHCSTRAHSIDQRRAAVCGQGDQFQRCHVDRGEGRS